jgi:hypothetical protein
MEEDLLTGKFAQDGKKVSSLNPGAGRGCRRERQTE